MVIIKIRVTDGKVAIFKVCCPQNAHKSQIRAQFYIQLEFFQTTTSMNDPKFTYGDLNVRVRSKYNDEDDIIGDNCFQGIEESLEVDSNRNVFAQF